MLGMKNMVLRPITMAKMCKYQRPRKPAISGKDKEVEPSNIMKQEENSSFPIANDLPRKKSW